jgi:hypothetical protein
MNEQPTRKKQIAKDKYLDPDAHRHSISLFYLPGRPVVPAAISFLVFGLAGIGPLLLGQEGKAMLLFGIEWLVVFPVGFLSGLLPVLLLLFHAAVAVDTWMIAQRLQVGQKVRKWEWWWQ